MLPYKNRLLEEKDFNRVYRLGRPASFGGVFIKMLRNNTEENRIGFVVGRKFSLLAVKRNKLKRQLREIIKKNWKDLEKGFDIVIMVKKSSLPEKIAGEWENDLKNTLIKGKIIIKKQNIK